MRVLKEGTRLADRYALIRRLGAGGMSDVWLAGDRQTDAPVVLKFLSMELADVAGSKTLLHKEWRIGSRMMHAHIARVFEFHDDPEGAFYSMQFVGESDLGVLGGQSPDIIMRPVGLVADALRYAHAKGVVHRDIKASNILLDARGAPYIIDFGVASRPGVQATGGSKIIASPQQLAGNAASTADDIYALGVLICELVSGTPPAGPGPVRLQTADGSVAPGALSSLTSDMLAVEAESRPDAETVLQRLRDAGFPPGPAPAGLAATTAELMPEAADATVQSIRPLHRPVESPPPVAATAASGVSSRIVIGALGGLLLLFLAVIFLLPEAIERPPSGQSGIEPAPQPAAGTDTEAGSASDSADRPVRGGGAFSENLDDVGGDDAASLRRTTDEVLGDLLSMLERLRYRAIDRWGGQPFLDVLNVYKAGDEAYLNKNYRVALERYREAINLLDPFFDRIDKVFEETLAAAREAFDATDHIEAVRLYDLAVAITPGHPEAEKGLARARNLNTVITLTDQGFQYEKDLELDAARFTFEKALEVDAEWEPAMIGLERVLASIKRMSFESRMTEGFDALAGGDYRGARAAFNAARVLDPQSTQPADGLLQVEQESRLANIRRLEKRAATLEEDEQWEVSVAVYEEILDIDADLQFAKEGLARSKSRAALHATIMGYIADPDSLSAPGTMQRATRLLLDMSRITPMGPRLEDQKGELARLLKRAATPLKVQLISDNATDVAIFKVGKLGPFSTHELELRPGNYVAVGSRPGYRDVRLEFRVAPEIEMKPIVIRCEEQF